MEKAWLILENGEKFEGVPFGANVCASGELVFNTAAAEYCETMTDARTAGDIVMFTFPLFGNYGVPDGDMPDGSVRAAGIVVREVCSEPSNFRCGETLDSYMKRNGIPGIYGVDTRRITQILREKGTVRAVISDTGNADFGACTSDLVSETSCKAPYTVGSGRKAAVIDYGAGKVPADELAARGFEVTVFPCDTKADTVLSGGFEGCVLSAGPGAPEHSAERIETVKALVGNIPVMGLGLGHQIMALSLGGKCVKLPFGHHGGSPVKEISTGKVIITDQNHKWAVVPESVPGTNETYVNLTDGSCEGLSYPGKQAFSLQFYPDGHFGQEFSYDSFVSMMGGKD